MLGNYVNKYINDRKNFSFVDEQQSRFNKTGDLKKHAIQSYDPKTEALSGV